MRAAQMVEAGHFVVVDAPDPEPGDGEVLVATRSASICGSDLHAVFEGTYRGEYPTAPGWPGHESVGRVVSSRSARFAQGELVLTVPMPGRGGCYAELQVVGQDFLVPLPAEADLDQLLLAQQLGTTVYTFHRYWPGRSPANGLVAGIIGAGSAGLFLLQLVRLAGFGHIVVADIDAGRLKVATELGADAVVHVPNESFLDAVAAGSGGNGADLVIEAAGFDECRTMCVEAVKYLGRIGFFGLPEHPGLVPFPLERAVRKGVSIEMAGNAVLETGLRSFRDAVALLAARTIDVRHMLDPRFSIEQIQQAMEVARDHAGVKISVDFTCD